MKPSKVSIDICIGHFECHGRIELRYPATTRRLWQKVAAKTLAFIRLPKVKSLMDKNAVLTNNWIIAQVALDRLASDRPYPCLSLLEARYAMHLISSTLLYWESTGRHWEWSRRILITTAEITRHLLDPLAPASAWGEADSRDCAVACYEQLRIVIGNTPGWLSLNQIYIFSFELKKYQGTNKGVLELKRQLGALSKSYHFALKRIQP